MVLKRTWYGSSNDVTNFLAVCFLFFIIWGSFNDWVISLEILFGLSLLTIILFFTRKSSILFGTAFSEIVGIPNYPASAVIVPPEPIKQSTLSNKSFPLTGFDTM